MNWAQKRAGRQGRGWGQRYRGLQAFRVCLQGQPLPSEKGKNESREAQQRTGRHAGRVQGGSKVGGPPGVAGWVVERVTDIVQTGSWAQAGLGTGSTRGGWHRHDPPRWWDVCSACQRRWCLRGCAGRSRRPGAPATPVELVPPRVAAPRCSAVSTLGWGQEQRRPEHPHTHARTWACSGSKQSASSDQRGTEGGPLPASTAAAAADRGSCPAPRPGRRTSAPAARPHPPGAPRLRHGRIAQGSVDRCGPPRHASKARRRQHVLGAIGTVVGRRLGAPWHRCSLVRCSRVAGSPSSPSRFTC